jgi:hypothetical protein
MTASKQRNARQQLGNEKSECDCSQQKCSHLSLHNIFVYLLYGMHAKKTSIPSLDDTAPQSTRTDAEVSLFKVQ